MVDVLSAPPARKMAFILDPSSVNAILKLYQSFGMQVLKIVFSMCRTYAYGSHRKKLILVGKWPYATRDDQMRIVVILITRLT